MRTEPGRFFETPDGERTVAGGATRDNGAEAGGELDVGIGAEIELLRGAAEITARENGSRFVEPVEAGGLTAFDGDGEGAISAGWSGLDRARVVSCGNSIGNGEEIGR